MPAADDALDEGAYIADLKTKIGVIKGAVKTPMHKDSFLKVLKYIGDLAKKKFKAQKPRN